MCPFSFLADRQSAGAMRLRRKPISSRVKSGASLNPYPRVLHTNNNMKTQRSKWPATAAYLVLFGTTIVSGQNLITNNPGFESGDGYYTAGNPAGLPGWFGTRIQNAYGSANDKTTPEGTRFVYIGNTALSTRAENRPAATPGQGYKLTFRASGDNYTGPFTARLVFYGNNTNYTPLATGTVSESFTPLLYQDAQLFSEHTLSGIAPNGTTHLGVTLDTPGSFNLFDDVRVELDGTVLPNLGFVSASLSFTGGSIRVTDTGPAVTNPGGTYLLYLQGEPTATPVTVSKVGDITTVSFNRAIDPNTDYNYALTVPRAGGTTQNFSGTVRSQYLPQTIPGASGASVGVWAIREFSTVVNDLPAASGVAVAAAPGTFVDQTAPVFNHSDPDTNGADAAGNFNNDLPVISNAAGNQDWVVVGKTRVSVPAPGNYTFSVHSDDGFGLRVSGGVNDQFTSVAGSAFIDAADTDTIVFNAGTADSNTTGVYNFAAAGTYDVTYLGWDGGGTGFYELAWAPGSFTADRDTNTWSLVGNPASPIVTAIPFRERFADVLLGPSGTAGNFGVRSYLNAGDANGNFNNDLDRVVAFAATTPRTVNGTDTFAGQVASLNCGDPEDGFQGGTIGNNTPFLGNTPAEDNEVVTVAKARIVVTTGGDYTFWSQGDDGFLLRVKGANGSTTPNFKRVSQGGGDQQGVFQMSNQNEMFFDGDTGNSDTRGVIFLAAGEYDLDFVHFEGGGGFNYELTFAFGAFPHGSNPPAGWRLVGAAQTNVITPGVTDPGWTVESSTPRRPEFSQTIAGAVAAINATLADPTAPAAKTSVWDFLDFRDPEDGNLGSFGPTNSWPLNTGGSDDNYAMRATGNIVITTAGSYVFGFQGDDGGYLRISGPGNPVWQSIVATNHPAEATITGNELRVEVGTGNSRTLASITLAAGTYTLQGLMYEGGGGSWWEGAFGGSNTGDPSSTYPLLVRGGGIITPGLALSAQGVVSNYVAVNSITMVGNPVTGVTINFSSMEGANYTVEASTNLTTWTNITNAPGMVGGNNTTLTINLSAIPALANQPRVFFRVFTN